MSYNGSGTFQINTSGQPVVTGTIISSTAFNSLTADLATGLSTAITKDGQTATTVRIPFAQGINSTLATDSTSGSTGSIITAGGVGISKALFVGTTANVASTTDSTSTTTGSIITAGGVGIAKSLYTLNFSLTGTGASKLNVGTTGERPTAATGMVRFNSTTGRFEGYGASSWGALDSIVAGTAVASTSGTSIDFTGIPSWVKRITVMFNGVSTSGTNQPLFQLGTSGGVQTSSYVTYASSIVTTANPTTAYTNGWQLFSGAAARIIQGSLVLTLIDATNNIWSGNGMFGNDAPNVMWTVGTKSLSSTLTTVRITTVGGTDTFDLGSINILYE
jgi:hypothetical protein